MAEYSISVNDLYLSYGTHKGTSIKNIFKNQGVTSEKYQALKGVSFSVEKSKILGVIGKNGSGKSTLLRTIGGVFCPDSGSVNLYGNRVSLLSIGVGFNEVLTGRENVILSGMLTGFSKREVLEKMDRIIEFSELGEFIDRPVNTYSSGMYSKLAFSVATELNTEIILIDEVLSVGDEHFAKKSYQRMKELIEDNNHTVVIVSHMLQTLEELCDEILWLHEGKIKMIGEPQRVLQQYKEFMQ